MPMIVRHLERRLIFGGRASLSVTIYGFGSTNTGRLNTRLCQFRPDDGLIV